MTAIHDATSFSQAGSSPLARGLQTLQLGLRVLDGIIPARAGFTRRSTGPRPPARDHPRSRGVYGGVNLTTIDTDGSSPLARGLPQPRDTGLRGRRIIPARAGFTKCI